MSYILEALQKSEHARQQGKVPDLSTVPVTTMGMPAKAAAGRLPYALAAFAITLVAAVLGWSRPWQERPGPQPGLVQQATPVQRPVATDAPVAEERKATAVPQAPQASGAPLPPAPPAALPLAATQPARAPLLVSSSPPPQSPSEDRVPPRVTPAAPALAPSATAGPVATPPASVATVAVFKDSQRPVASAGAPPRSVEAPAARRVEANPPETPDAAPAHRQAPGERILSIHELPQSVRSGLPRLIVSGFAYSEEPGRRSAVINDRLVQEGEEAESGVTVTTVARDGVVLHFQGYRFRP